MVIRFGPPTPGVPPRPLRSLFSFKRIPHKLHKDGWGSAAFLTFFTLDRRWGSLKQISALLPAGAHGTRRIAPCLRVCSKVIMVSPFSLIPPPPPLLPHRLLPTGALQRDCMKKGSLQGDEMRPSLVSKFKLRASQASPKVLQRSRNASGL